MAHERTDAPDTRVGHINRDNYDVYIGRHGSNGDLVHLNNSEIGERGWLGNPYTVEEYGREEAVSRYVTDLFARLDDDPEFRRAVAELRGSVLGCWCHPIGDDGPLCHGDVLAEVIDDALRKVADESADVRRRKRLMRECEQLPVGASIEMEWDSRRGGDVAVEARVLEIPVANDDAVLQARSDDRKGELVVEPVAVENDRYGELRVLSTGSRGTNRQTTVGDLIRVERVEADDG